MVDGPMPSIDPLSGSLLPELEDRFWTRLRDALERILGADGELANQYRLHLESASPYEKLLEPDSKDNYRASRLIAIWMQARVTNA